MSNSRNVRSGATGHWAPDRAESSTPRFSRSESPGMTRAFLSLLAAVLAVVALAIFFALGVQPAQADHTLSTPANLRLKGGNGRVLLSWQRAGQPISQTYEIQHKKAAGTGIMTTTITTASSDLENNHRLISGLTIDTAYKFRVRSKAGTGHTDSGWTDWVTFTVPDAKVICEDGRCERPIYRSLPLFGETYIVESLVLWRGRGPYDGNLQLTTDKFMTGGHLMAIRIGAFDNFHVIEARNYGIDENRYPYSGSGGMYGERSKTWPNSGLSWATGDTVGVNIVYNRGIWIGSIAPYPEDTINENLFYIKERPSTAVVGMLNHRGEVVQEEVGGMDVYSLLVAMSPLNFSS